MPDRHLKVTKFKYSELNLWTPPSHIHSPCPANSTPKLAPLSSHVIEQELHTSTCLDSKHWGHALSFIPCFLIFHIRILRIPSLFSSFKICPESDLCEDSTVTSSHLGGCWSPYFWPYPPSCPQSSSWSDPFKKSDNASFIQTLPMLKGLIQSGTGKVQNEPGTLCSTWKGSAQRLLGVCQKDNGGNSL